MSARYAVAGVLTLISSASPCCKPIRTGNPWIEGSPDPTSHWEGGAPGNAFSHTTGIVAAAQPEVAFARGDSRHSRTAANATTGITGQRPHFKRLAVFST